MTLTMRALAALHAFDHRLPVAEGLAFESLLRAARLDYSVQSLERIDIFLDALRKTRKIDQSAYLGEPATRNLLSLLAFYTGEVIGRCLGAQPHWFTYEDMAARERQADGPTFENSATLAFPGGPPALPFFAPLVAITARLFHEPPDQSVLSSAGLLLPPEALQRPACLQPLPPVPAPAWPVPVHPIAFEAPPGPTGDALRHLVDHTQALLRDGRVVWGAVVQADNALMQPGPPAGAPGEILYDPRGRAPDADLHATARTVLSLKGRRFDLPELASLAQSLADDSVRVFGLELPARISPYPLYLSSTWFSRAHLPGGVLAQPLIPVLISDAHPGAVLPLPAQFWPDNLREAWSPAGLQPMAEELVVTAAPAAYVPDPELAHLEPAGLVEEGLHWFEGSGVPQDYAKARLAWSKAAAAGNAAGLEGLGRLYEQGLGVDADLHRALGYYEQAAARDHGQARDSAERIRKQAAGRGSVLGRIFRR